MLVHGKQYNGWCSKCFGKARSKIKGKRLYIDISLPSTACLGEKNIVLLSLMSIPYMLGYFLNKTSKL